MYVYWDLFLFMILFPYLFTYKNHFKIFGILRTVLFFIHAYIAYMRYFLGREIEFPLWCELVSIFLYGSVFAIDGYRTKNHYILALGVIIAAGHFRKILWPNCPYYY